MTGRDAPALDFERLTRLNRVTSLALAPDGRSAVCGVERPDAHDAKYVGDLHRVMLDDDLPAHRLTQGEHDDRAPAFRRDGAIGFLSDRPTPTDPDAEHRSQVWLLPAPGGEPRPVTDEPLGVAAFCFASHGDRLVVLAPMRADTPLEAQRETADALREHGPSELHWRDMPVRYWDHWEGPTTPHLVVFDGDGGRRRDLTDRIGGELRHSALTLSDDGRRVAVTARVPSRDRIGDDVLVLLDLDAPDAAPLRIGEPSTKIDAPVFSADGASVAYAVTLRGTPDWHRVEVRVADLRTGAVRVVGGDADRFLTPACFSPDGASLYCTADDRGRVPVFRIDLATGDVDARTAPEHGGSHANPRACPDGRLVCLRDRVFHPPEPFLLDAELAMAPRPLATLSGFSAAEGEAMARLEDLEVTSRDGRPVHGLLVTPTSGTAAAPAFFWIHGGPVGAFGDGWHWRWNALVMIAEGFAVALPNARGSTGYGQRFVAEIYGNAWGAACCDDLIAFLDAVAARDDVDAARMLCMGGSFGGYMTNWMASHEHRFAGYVTHASLWDLGAFQGVTDLPAFFAYALGGSPLDDPESFERHSPHRFAADVRGPMLILHGEKDYRVPVGEALALFEALRARDVDAELSIFPDENHWILKPRNIRAWYARVLAFARRVTASARERG